MESLLIVEDDITFAVMLKTWLGKKGFKVSSVTSVAAAQRVLEKEEINLILSDLRLPDKDGTALLEWMQTGSLSTPLIIMTGYAEVGTAVQAMKLGARDYISKPIQPEELLRKIGEALRQPLTTAIPPESKPATPKKNEQTTAAARNYLEGESEVMRQLYRHVKLVAPTQMSVLIHGASGTGKEYVAHSIHRESKRADRPFVALDCGSIPKELAASEFFGHVKGSFTGAVTDKVGAFVEANGGTLFLDEVGNLTYEVQVQLLRALQERKIRPIGSNKEIEVDVRVVSATNENLEQGIRKGTFREDLYHRLNEFPLHIPLLKDRAEDILLFADFFLDQANRELDRDLVGFDHEAYSAMQRYSWPGNLRQMGNVIKRAALLAQGRFITLADIASELIEPVVESAAFVPTASALPLATATLRDEEKEKALILEALRFCGGNKSKAATRLGIDRKTLYNKLKLYGIVG